MDGRNSAGVRVSLLNDSPASASARPSLAISAAASAASAAAVAASRASAAARSGTGAAESSGSSIKQQRSGPGLAGGFSLSLGLGPGPGASGFFGTSGARRPATSLAAAHSRTSSFASTPILSSPSTPQLVRSDSSDSAMMNRTPSPVTPVGLGFDALTVSHDEHDSASVNPTVVDAQFASHLAGSAFFPGLVPLPAQPKGPSSLTHYPPIGQHHPSPFAYPTQPSLVFPPSATGNPLQLPPQLAQQSSPRMLAGVISTTASANPGTATSSASSASKGPSKKNHYPCPLAKEYNCNNFFTTSGHAARHAKKHTGKKDAFCPECNKAFTRKDNMEQHRRTHQNGRNASKSNDTGEAPAKRQKTSASQPKRPKVAPLEASAPAIDPSLPVSPASSFGFPDAASLGLSASSAPQAYPAELLQQGPFGQITPYPITPYFDSSSMSGLDKLAMAASGQTSRQNSGSL